MKKWMLSGLAICSLLATADSALAQQGPHGKAKAPKAKAKVAVATEQTARAIGELAGMFKWGMTTDEVTKLVVDDTSSKYEDRIRKEKSPFQQDAVRKEMSEKIDRFRKSFVKFDGQKTGWDVSIADSQFAHKNNEAMMLMGEKQQRRFLFFHEGKLWKQFIVFDAEHPAFAGKTFDDFADVIQKRYGPSSMTFKKMRTSDEQTLDHLEWPPSGDFLLWAIDLTNFYGNFCLSLMQKSKIAEIEKGRKENSPQRSTSNSLVDSVMRGTDPVKPDTNADIVDEITGRERGIGDAPAKKPSSASAGSKKGGKAAQPETEKEETKTVDPLEGTNF